MKSIAFKKFKNEMGQANHFLITLLVGLDAISDGARKSEDFSASWNPKDIESSVVRSRLYAIKSSMAWTVDNLDMYFKLIRRKPTLFSFDDQSFNDVGTSVYKKFNCFNSKFELLGDNKKAFVDLLINWRNNTMHFDVSNKLLKETQIYFDKNAMNDSALSKYNFNSLEMINRFNDNKVPTFKECATLISMTINYVSQLDELVMSQINQINYINNVLTENLNETELAKMFITKATLVLTVDNTIYQKRLRKIIQFLKTQGLDFNDLNSQAQKHVQEIVTFSIEKAIKLIKNQ